MPFIESLDNFINAYINSSTEDNQGLLSEFDEEFDSPCYQSKNLKTGDLTTWKPVVRDIPGKMVNISNALDLKIHQDVETLFGRYFSLDLNAKTERGQLTLLQALNEDDYARLQKNLIAHVLMKRRLKQPETLFIALTDEEDVLISVLPDSGEVVLEVVGKPHQESLASDLKSFFDNLTPNPKRVEL